MTSKRVLAAVCTDLVGEDGVQLQERSQEPIGDAGIRLEVHAASVNYPDCLMVRGEYQHRLEPPFVAGSECAGVVIETGPKAAGVEIGDRVLALSGAGAFATDVVVPAGMQVHRIPASMPFDEAAAFNMTYGTAYHALARRAALRAGESVLVLGAAGGCGSAAIQIGKASGCTVIAVAGGDSKCDLARSLGADVVIDHLTCDSLSAAVREATGGRGVDVVFDPVGGADIREQLRCLAWEGRYLVIGFVGGGIPVVRLNQTIMKGISLVGVAYGMSAALNPAANAEDFAQLFAWYKQGLVKPAIGARLPLAATAEAMRMVQDRQALGKVVVQVPQDPSLASQGAS